jgi:hypothetical protein
LLKVKAERLRELLFYYPKTGSWTWLVAVGRGPSRRYAGDAAGCHRGDGYIIIGIDGRNYLAHQLAWFWMKGEWIPEIDHEDLDGANNKWSNLRRASKSQNQANRPTPLNNTSGIKGVFWDKRCQKWQAQIMVNGVRIGLGNYLILDEAGAAYRAAAEKYFGQFARAA